MRIDDKQICRYLKLYGRSPGAALDERIKAMREAALAAIRPAHIWKRFDDLSVVDAGGSSLAKHLAGCHAVYLVCTTIGASFDALQRRMAATSPSDAFVLQAIGAAAIEKWMDSVEDEIRLELLPGETLRPRYSPGYGDFPLEVQREMVTVLDTARRIGASRPAGVGISPRRVRV